MYTPHDFDVKSYV